MTTSPAVRVRPLAAGDEAAVAAFIAAHPAHGPGHHRAFATVERARGHRELSVVAERGGRIVGYAPAFLIPQVTLRVLRLHSAAGGSLVAAGPLASDAESLAALVSAVRARGAATKATRLQWVMAPMVDKQSELGAHPAAALLPLGAALGVIAGPVVSLSAEPPALLAGCSASTRTLLRRAERAVEAGALRVETLEGVDAAAALAQVGGVDSAAVVRTAFGGAQDAAAAFGAVCESVLASAPGLAHAVVVWSKIDGAGSSGTGAPLGAVVTCEANGWAYYLLAFNTAAGLAVEANRLALWRALLGARSRGVRWFQLGSLDHGEGKAARIAAFKRQFGGRVVGAPVASWELSPVRAAAIRLAEGLVQWVRRML